MVSGMPELLSRSPELGIVLIVERMNRGLHEPKSFATNELFAGGGCAA